MKKNTLAYAALGGAALVGAWFLLRKEFGKTTADVIGNNNGIIAKGVLQRSGSTIKFNGTISGPAGTDRLFDVWLEAATVSPQHTILSSTGAYSVQQVSLTSGDSSRDVALTTSLAVLGSKGRVKAWLIYAEGAGVSRKQYTLIDSDDSGIDFGSL